MTPEQAAEMLLRLGQIYLALRYLLLVGLLLFGGLVYVSYKMGRNE